MRFVALLLALLGCTAADASAPEVVRVDSLRLAYAVQPATWAATCGTVVAINDSQAVFRSSSAGTCRVIASVSGAADTATVTVTSPPPPPGCSGIAVAAGSSIQGAVNAAPTGATFCLAAGTYAHQSVSPKGGQSFIGARGPNGERLSVLDGQGLMFAFTGTVDAVTIRGLVIRGYAPQLSDGAVFLYKSTNVRLLDNEITANSPGGGTDFFSGWLIRKNWIHHNGEAGVEGQADAVGATVDSNEIGYNNVNGTGSDGTSGGMKAVRQTNLTVRGNFVHHNANKGLWCDYCGTGNVIRGNRVEDNAGIGIYLEVSHAATIDSNTVRRNGSSNRGGIWVDNSDHVDVSYNTVSGSPQGAILLRMVSHSVPASDRNLNNVFVHDNAITLAGTEYTGGVQFVSDPSYFTSKGNRYDRNRYMLPSSNSASFRWDANSNISKTSWLAAGQDPNGTFAP